MKFHFENIDPKKWLSKNMDYEKIKVCNNGSFKKNGFQKNGWCRKLVPKTEEPKRPFFGWYSGIMEALETSLGFIVDRSGMLRASCILGANKIKVEISSL